MAYWGDEAEIEAEYRTLELNDAYGSYDRSARAARIRQRFYAMERRREADVQRVHQAPWRPAEQAVVAPAPKSTGDPSQPGPSPVPPAVSHVRPRAVRYIARYVAHLADGSTCDLTADEHHELSHSALAREIRGVVGLTAVSDVAED